LAVFLYHFIPKRGVVIMAKITKPQFVALQKKHVTDTAIAAALSVSRQSVHQLRSKFGIKPSQPDVRTRNASMVEAYKSGETGISIAKKYGLSISQTYRILDAALDKAKKKTARATAKLIRKSAKTAVSKDHAGKTAAKKNLAAKASKKKTAKKKKRI
jgi:uncharacterized protein (DUF433 family)